MHLHVCNVTLMRRLVMAGAMAATLAGIGAAPALADDWGHGWRDGDGWPHEAFRRHEWREHEWRERHGFFAPGYYASPRYYYYYPPSYTYVPPPVVYPPPAYVTPGLSLGFYFR